MVSINRSNIIPGILAGAGKEETDKNIASYQSDPLAYQNGRKFSFNTNIYGHDSVKESLKTSQHDKCCFCESQVTHVAYGDVEHFRPKAGYLQNPDDDLQRPGYFWLVYEWTNLLFCCQICNQRFKKNLFPLLDPATRAASPDDDISNENPVFVNPAEENPEDYIGFRGDTPYTINGSRRGEDTITALGLKREPLRGRRADLLEKLKLVYDFANQFPQSPHSARAQQLFQKAIDPKAEYSIAIKFALNDGFMFM